MLAPLGIVFYMSFGIKNMSAAKAQTVFWIFAALWDYHYLGFY